MFRNAYQHATFGVSVCDVRPKLEPKVPTSWLLLPFDLVLGSAGIEQALDLITIPFCCAFSRVSVGWYKGNKHLMHLLRRYCFGVILLDASSMPV